MMCGRMGIDDTAGSNFFVWWKVLRQDWWLVDGSEDDCEDKGGLKDVLYGMFCSSLLS